MVVAFLFVAIVVGVISAAVGVAVCGFSLLVSVLIYAAFSTVTFLVLAFLSFLSSRSADNSIGHKADLGKVQKLNTLHKAT